MTNLVVASHGISSDGNYKARLTFLDGLRGLAALYVMLGHARWLLWEGFSDGFVQHPATYSLPAKALAYGSLTLYYGHQAVIFFYVLSGFVIHLKYANALNSASKSGQPARFDVLPFLWRRFKRIYPLFALAMLVTLALDQFGAVHGFPIYFQRTPYALINTNISADFSLRVAVGNGLLWVNAPTWGSNGPLWSLRTEWWFYLAYPIFWLLSRRSLRWATLGVFGLFALSFMQGIWPLETLRLVFAAFPAWWLGALLADVYAGRLHVRFVRIAPLCGLFVVLPFLVAPLIQLDGTLQDFLWALGFAGVIAACLAWRNRGGALHMLERLKPLGDVSYALYVLHFPILTLISGWLMTQTPDGTLPHDFGWVAIGSGVCLGIAIVAHQLIEKPLMSSKKTLYQRPPIATTRLSVEGSENS